MRKVIVPAYKYDGIRKIVVDRYICSECSKVVKEEERRVESKSKLKRSSFVYYIICLKCKSGK